MRTQGSKLGKGSSRRTARRQQRSRRKLNLEALEHRNLLAADDCGCGFVDPQLANDSSLLAHVAG